MSMAEVMTCVRENIPAIAVVFNNGQWGAEKKNQVDFYRLENLFLKVPSFKADFMFTKFYCLQRPVRRNQFG